MSPNPMTSTLSNLAHEEDDGEIGKRNFSLALLSPELISVFDENRLVENQAVRVFVPLNNAIRYEYILL